MLGNQEEKKTDFTYWRSSMQKVRHIHIHLMTFTEMGIRTNRFWLCC